ncbi:MAG: FAD-binding oxidoreductase [Gammaproteobacteria bacterium]|nr:FAD-binding oxidoreductase [Gammaproteobacteria bacterium]
MPIITYDNNQYLLQDNESILSCLKRNGVEYPSSCQAGICQSCLIKAPIANRVDASWQNGIQDTLKAQNYFLACLAKPIVDFHLESPNAAECETVAKILEIKALTYNVLAVYLSVADLTKWIPGQYISIINPAGIIRSYSIANLPVTDGYIELHIKLCSGLMTSWLKEHAKVGDSLNIRGPMGQCFYFNPKRLNYAMLLIGTGTGLAPLVAIVRSALSQDHQGEITLIHGGRTDQDLYYLSELKALSLAHPNFHYENCVLKSEGLFSEMPIDKKMLLWLKDPSNLHLYVCGPKETTSTLKTKAFLAGVPSSKILSDAFL